MKYPLHFTSSYFQPVTQQYESELFEKHLCNLWKMWTISVSKGSHHVLAPNQHLSLSAKMNGTQRRTLVSPWRMHCTYCGMPKDTCRAEATSNSEKNQTRSLSCYRVTLVWRNQSVTYLLTQSVSRKFCRIKKI